MTVAKAHISEHLRGAALLRGTVPLYNHDLSLVNLQSGMLSSGLGPTDWPKNKRGTGETQAEPEGGAKEKLAYRH